MLSKCLSSSNCHWHDHLTPCPFSLLLEFKRHNSYRNQLINIKHFLWNKCFTLTARCLPIIALLGQAGQDNRLLTFQIRSCLLQSHIIFFFLRSLYLNIYLPVFLMLIDLLTVCKLAQSTLNSVFIIIVKNFICLNYKHLFKKKISRAFNSSNFIIKVLASQFVFQFIL